MEGGSHVTIADALVVLTEIPNGGVSAPEKKKSGTNIQ